MDWTAITVAGIGGGAAVMAAGLPAYLSMKRAERKVDAVHDEVRTNHGKAAREYLEMVAEVKTTVEVVAAQQGALVNLLAEHTLQDDRNFKLLRDEIRALEDRVSA